MLTIKRKNMKKNIITRMAFILAAAVIFASCGKTAIEESQDAYSASDVVPVVLSTSGPTVALQTFTYDFKVTYARAGSTWSWSSADETVSTVSADTRTASVLFDKLPTSGKAIIKVTETTAGGVTSPEKLIEVTVNKFCPLATSGFVGTWTGTDGQADFTYPADVTTTLSGTQILVDGLNVGFMGDFWAETIISGGTCLMTVNPDGTLTIAEQYFCDTDYSVGYRIKGSGLWDNCGSKPKLTINYDVWYPDGNYWIAAKYAANYLGGKAYLTATLTMN
jgi:hypothetical protein